MRIKIKKLSYIELCGAMISFKWLDWEFLSFTYICALSVQEMLVKLSFKKKNVWDEMGECRKSMGKWSNIRHKSIFLYNYIGMGICNELTRWDRFANIINKSAVASHCRCDSEVIEWKFSWQQWKAGVISFHLRPHLLKSARYFQR